MPPIKKFDREKIIETVKDMIARDGKEEVNARSIARELGSSVQPIFHYFKSMEDLMEKVNKSIYEVYMSYMKSALGKEKVYKELGLSYIRFAKENPEFFKILFMRETNVDAYKFITNDESGNMVIEAGSLMTKLSHEEQIKFHARVWMLTHGIACLLATKTIKISDKEIDEILESSVKYMLKGYLMERNM